MSGNHDSVCSLAFFCRLLDAVGRDVVDDVQFAGLQAGEADGRLGDLALDDAVEIGRAFPVIVEAGELDLVAEFAPHEFERAGADRARALLVAGAHGDDGAGAVLGEAAEERRVDPLHLDDDGLVVGRVDRVDVVEHLEVDGAGLRVAAAVEGIFDVSRRHRLAVVEFNAGPQVERIGQQVRARLEFLGEARDDG